MKPAPEKHTRILLGLACLAVVCTVPAAAQPIAVQSTSENIKSLNLRCGEWIELPKVPLHCIEGMVNGTHMLYTSASSLTIKEKPVFKKARTQCDDYVKSYLYSDNCRQMRLDACSWNFECDLTDGTALRKAMPQKDFPNITNFLKWGLVELDAFNEATAEVMKDKEFLKMAENKIRDMGNDTNIYFTRADIDELHKKGSSIEWNHTKGYKFNSTSTEKYFVSEMFKNDKAECHTIVYNELKKQNIIDINVNLIGGWDFVDIPDYTKKDVRTYHRDEKPRYVCGLSMQHILSNMLRDFHTLSNQFHGQEAAVVSNSKCDKWDKKQLDKCRGEYSNVSTLWTHATGEAHDGYCEHAIKETYVECMPKCACKGGDAYDTLSVTLVNLSNVFRTDNKCLTMKTYDEKCADKIKSGGNVSAGAWVAIILCAVAFVGICAATIFIKTKKTQSAAMQQNPPPNTAPIIQNNTSVDVAYTPLPYGQTQYNHQKHHPQYNPSQYSHQYNA